MLWNIFINDTALINNDWKTIIFLQALLLQKSNKRDLSVIVNMHPSSAVENRLQLHHNARDYDEIIHAYIDTILGKFFCI